MTTKKPEVRPELLRESMMQRVHRRMAADGRLSLPCAPSLIDAHFELLAMTFRSLGRALNKEEQAHLKKVLSEKLAEGWRHSPYCKLLVEYKTDPPPKVSLSYLISVQFSDMASEYENWVDTRTPPLFGAHADARAVKLAAELGLPMAVPILDAGAGTGRNTLPLARAGYPTTAVEMAPALAGELEKAVQAENLPVKVVRGDILSPSLPLAPGSFKLILLAEVVASHFRSQEQLQKLFERAAVLLAPGGMLLFNAFLAHDSYTPDRLVRELGEVFWSCVFTRKDMANACPRTLERVSDESAHDYEKANLPPEAWPPTGWYADWASGYDVYAPAPLQKPPPIELRWLVYKRV